MKSNPANRKKWRVQIREPPIVSHCMPSCYGSEPRVPLIGLTNMCPGTKIKSQAHTSKEKMIMFPGHMTRGGEVVELGSSLKKRKAGKRKAKTGFRPSIGCLVETTPQRMRRPLSRMSASQPVFSPEEEKECRCGVYLDHKLCLKPLVRGTKS